MTVKAVLELKLNPDTLEEARGVLKKVLDETRAFDGSVGVETLVDQGDPTHLIIIEEWQSAEHDAAYRTFRAGPGATSELGPLLAGAPALTKVDIDPAV
jgi:quinol monooxygenase YgiN